MYPGQLSEISGIIISFSKTYNLRHHLLAIRRVVVSVIGFTHSTNLVCVGFSLRRIGFLGIIVLYAVEWKERKCFRA